MISAIDAIVTTSKENIPNRSASVGKLLRSSIRVMIAFAALSFGGCIETIDFDVERTGGRLAVDGMITDTPGPHTIKLRRTSDRAENSNPLGGASITITDDLGNSETYRETAEGTYELEETGVQGVPGRTYHIEITLPNGSNYRSQPETIPEANARDSIYYEFDTIETISPYGATIDTDVLRIYKETFVPATDDPLYLKWEVLESYKFTEFDFPDFLDMPPPACYITQRPDPQSVHLYDGSELAAGPLKSQVMAVREVDHAFYTRYYANLVQYSISARAHEYWSQVDQVINQSGTIFDVPPANASGNIYNVDDRNELVLGYFHAAAVDTTRFFVTQGEVPFFINNPCTSPNGPHCTNCLKMDNSSREPPFFWLNN